MRKTNGLPALQAERIQPQTYLELMQGLVYTPAMKSSQRDFFAKCAKLMAKHRVTLRIPQVIKADYYVEFTQRLRDALQRTVRLKTNTHMNLKEILRKHAENAKKTARI